MKTISRRDFLKGALAGTAGGNRGRNHRRPRRRGTRCDNGGQPRRPVYPRHLSGAGRRQKRPGDRLHDL